MLSFMLGRILPALLLSSLARAAVDQSSVGPLTSLSSKSTVCSVLDYGGVADGKTDIGPAILSAFTECASKGAATLYIPPGNYSMATGVILNKGSAYAIQLDGLITLTSDGSFDGNAIVVKNAQDVEMFSSNGLGAIDGQGYITRRDDLSQNARLVRFISSSNIAIHDIILVDSPTFHLVFNDVSNLEAYHITIRGPDIGGTDGIDLICTDNCYLHHIEVTNRDECVCVKTPSSNVLIEEIYCNQSGGMSIGSLTADGVTSTDAAAVSNITMRNIYVYQCTQMLMIKTFPGGDGATGYVKDSVFENFWAYDTIYGLDIDQYWQTTNTPNTGAVALTSLTFNNWTGTVNNGANRAPIVIRGSDQVPLQDVTFSNFDMWTENGDTLEHQCKNVYGSGYCARTSTASPLATFTSTMTVTATPAAYTVPTKPDWGVDGYGTTDPIPIYTPAVFWSVASGGALSSVATTTATFTSSATAMSSSVTTPLSSQSGYPLTQTKVVSLSESSATTASTRSLISASATLSSFATTISKIGSQSVPVVSSSYASSSPLTRQTRTRKTRSIKTLSTSSTSATTLVLPTQIIPVSAFLNTSSTVLPSVPSTTSSRNVTVVTATIPVIPVVASDGSISTPAPTTVTILSSSAVSSSSTLTEVLAASSISTSVAATNSIPDHMPSFYSASETASPATTTAAAAATATYPAASSTASVSLMPADTTLSDLLAWLGQMLAWMKGNKD